MAGGTSCAGRERGIGPTEIQESKGIRRKGLSFLSESVIIEIDFLVSGLISRFMCDDRGIGIDEGASK